MSQNDVIFLDSIIHQRKLEIGQDLRDDVFFELFSIEQVLKIYDLSYDELKDGQVGSGDDGGIDGFYCFIDGELLREDFDRINLRSKPTIELFIIQAKRSQSFSEDVFDKLISTSEQLFDLTKDLNALKSFFNVRLIEKVGLFRETYLGIASKHPQLKIKISYSSRGDSTEVHHKVKNKANNLKGVLTKQFSGAPIETEFLGARELIDQSRIERKYTLQINFLENYLSRGDNNYILLSSIADYYKFVTDEHKNLRRYIFEANVRDYLGSVEVNNDIEKTLKSEENQDFWWFNNGITIIASKASIVGKTITLDDVQVVNGLQTTNTIYNYLREREINDKDIQRSILIRIIVADEQIRDKIIKATNFQNAIPIASLRATERLQRDIEDYFKKNDLYYDRRKNYYKNIGKPVEKIISIPYLAQAIMAVLLLEPDNARARPSSLIKKDDDYQRVFSQNIDPSIYLFCASLLKRIDLFNRTVGEQFEDRYRNNLKFHIAMVCTINLLKNCKYSINDITKITDYNFSDDELITATKDCSGIANEFINSNGLQLERIAKSRDFVLFLLEKLNEKLTK